MAAQSPGVKSGKGPADPIKVENKVAAAKNLLAAGWSRATLYRYLKEYEAWEPMHKRALPPRD
jgi:hypothetical protein